MVDGIRMLSNIRLFVSAMKIADLENKTIMLFLTDNEISTLKESIVAEFPNVSFIPSKIASQFNDENHYTMVIDNIDFIIKEV